MKITLNIVVIFLAALMALLIAVYGAERAFASPSGATFSPQGAQYIVWAPATAAATTTSLTNNTGSDLVVKELTYTCNGIGTSQTPLTGAGLATWTFQAATTSTANPVNLGSNTNYVLSTVIATSSTELFTSSTTPGVTGTVGFRRWAAGSSLTFSANATNTAICTIGVQTLQN